MYALYACNRPGVCFQAEAKVSNLDSDDLRGKTVDDSVPIARVSIDSVYCMGNMTLVS